MKKLIAVICLALLFAGCGKNEDSSSTTGTTDSASVASFTLAASEYPSWSVFDVAHEMKLIDKEKGKLGSIEKAHGVDIVLKMVDYDTCISMYGSKTADAVCITNIDILSPSLGRDSVAILPTSTSVGSDACIVEKSVTLEALKGKTTHGLENSVSQYVFERCLEIKGLKPADYKFKNMDPQAASVAFQNKQESIESVMVWNPFVMQTLRKRADSKVLFDSKEIPEEVIDMVVVGKDSLAKDGGDKFAKAIVEVFYAVNKALADEKTGDQAYVALGKKFSSLDAKDMREVCTQTVFYKNAAEAKALFTKKSFQEKTMPTVVDFCLSHKLVDKKPTVGYDDDKAQLNFSTKYLK